MPYINSIARKKFDNITSQILMSTFTVPGSLNYLFTMLIKRYLACQGESYTAYNDIIGALEACKLELYARKVRPYEDKKIAENTDVY